MAFIEHFGSLTDLRCIHIQYDLYGILFLVVLAILLGAEGGKYVKVFGDAKLEWLIENREFNP